MSRILLSQPTPSPPLNKVSSTVYSDGDLEITALISVNFCYSISILFAVCKRLNDIVNPFEAHSVSEYVARSQ